MKTNLIEKSSAELLRNILAGDYKFATLAFPWDQTLQGDAHWRAIFHECAPLTESDRAYLWRLLQKVEAYEAIIKKKQEIEEIQLLMEGWCLGYEELLEEFKHRKQQIASEYERLADKRLRLSLECAELADDYCNCEGQ